MNTFRLKVSTPEGLKFDAEAERIVESRGSTAG